MSADDWMSVDEAAAALGHKRRTAYDEIKATGHLAGTIPVVKVGSRIRLSRRAVEALVAHAHGERVAS